MSSLCFVDIQLFGWLTSERPGGRKWELKIGNAKLPGIWVSDHRCFISMHNLFSTPPSLINYRSLKGKLCQEMGNCLAHGGAHSVRYWASLTSGLRRIGSLLPFPSTRLFHPFWEALTFSLWCMRKGDSQQWQLLMDSVCLVVCLSELPAMLSRPLGKASPECNQCFN